MLWPSGISNLKSAVTPQLPPVLLVPLREPLVSARLPNPFPLPFRRGAGQGEASRFPAPFPRPGSPSQCTPKSASRLSKETTRSPLPPLPVLRPLGTMLRPPPQECPLRRLGLVSARWKTVAALTRQTARPPHPLTTSLAGPKLRSRPRLAQSGPLNKQHYSLRRHYSTPAAPRPPDAKTSIKPLQTKGVSLSSSDRYRTSAGPLSHQQACPTPRAGHNQPGRPPRTLPSQKPRAVSPRNRSPASLRLPLAARRTIPLAAPSRHRRFEPARNRSRRRQSAH